MSHAPIKVTVSDPATGDVLEERVLENDFMLLCHGDRYLAHAQAYANGTKVLTVKRDTKTATTEEPA